MAHSELYIGSLTTPVFYFADDDLISATGAVSVDLMSEEMKADSMEHSVVFDKAKANAQLFSPKDYDALYDANFKVFRTSYEGAKNLVNVPYGTPVWYKFDGNLIGKFYTNTITRVKENKYEIVLMSCIGLLTNLMDDGGVFSISGGDTFRSVLAKILGGTVGSLVNGQYPITGGVFDCYVEQQAGILPIAGWLPIDTKRNNLHQLCFSESVALLKSADGTPVFSHIYSQTTPDTIANDKIYEEGSINYGAPATAVNVTEHTYLNLGTSDTLVTLFDGSAEGSVTMAKVEFDEPCHGSNVSAPYTSWVITGDITVHSAGANYAIITGSGTLQGYKYTHSQKVLRREIASPTGETNEKSISSITLINPTNSANVADRAINYYSKAKTIDTDAVVTNGNPKAGRQYSFTDPFKEAATGFVTNIEFSASNILKATCHIITDYTPTGQGNNYSHAVLKTSGNWSVPSGVTKCRAILIGGGQGGTAGTAGADGTPCTMRDTQVDTTTSTGGAGGNAGTAGNAGKVLTVDLTGLSSGQTLSLTYGAGGATEGGAGGNTTLTKSGTTYSSANGQIPAGGIINLFTGAVYATHGAQGYGGAGGGTFNAAGGSVTIGGTVYQGGAAGREAENGDSGSGWFYRNTWLGGGGGGAAYGASGGDGHPQYDTDHSSDGGNGATPITPSAAAYGCGGTAGSGGGGGGGGGYEESVVWVTGSAPQTSYTVGRAGSGSQGSSGGTGGAGCVLIYY